MKPAVAATQFTAYMALMNLCISYTALWQGWAVERWGYPVTLLVDCLVGLLGMALLPFMRPLPKEAVDAADAVRGRDDDAMPPLAQRTN